MQLNAYLEELKPLINIDCGTSTVEGVAAVAEMMAQKYRDLNWHTEVVDLGAKAGQACWPLTSQTQTILMCC